MFGAEISFLNKKNYLNVNEIMKEESNSLARKGSRVYVIPEGGSTTLGIWGYISFINELKLQTDLSKVNGILSAAGTGGTAAGLLVGTSLNQINFKIFAVNVLYSKKELKKKILHLAEGVIADYNLKCKIDESNLEIIDGYSKEGYKNINDDKLKLITAVSKETGIMLDPAYTGKAFNAYYDLFLSKNKGRKIIFLHTGGLFGIFSKRKKYLNNL